MGLVFDAQSFPHKTAHSELRILRLLRILPFQDETYATHPLFAKTDRLSGEVMSAATLVRRIRNVDKSGQRCHDGNERRQGESCSS